MLYYYNIYIFLPKQEGVKVKMGKVADFFLGFKKRYDAHVIRNQKMDEFLTSAKQNFNKIDKVDTAVSDIGKQVATLEGKVDDLQGQMNAMDSRLEVIGRGTKIELLETLYRWRKLLVERGWKTKEEMKEIQELYEIYNKKLNGNGQGTAYYHDIEALPEREIA